MTSLLPVSGLVFFAVCLSVCLLIYLSVCLSVCLFVCLSVCLSFFLYLSDHLTNWLSMCLWDCPSVWIILFLIHSLVYSTPNCIAFQLSDLLPFISQIFAPFLSYSPLPPIFLYRAFEEPRHSLKERRQDSQWGRRQQKRFDQFQRVSLLATSYCFPS